MVVSEVDLIGCYDVADSCQYEYSTAHEVETDVLERRQTRLRELDA